MDDSWTPPRQTGYAVELWALPEEFNGSILVSLFSRVNPEAQNQGPGAANVGETDSP
jgi:hypothetical protein